VATALLPPGDIAVPIRHLVRKQPNALIAMAELIGVDAERRQVHASAPDRGDIVLPYDYLILATGVGRRRLRSAISTRETWR